MRKSGRGRGPRVQGDTTRSGSQLSRSTLDYLLALFFFACGLMSKPMVVTLPFVLLLLDFWPLKFSVSVSVSVLKNPQRALHRINLIRRPVDF